jgi:catechol 2,3-dioxygenase-like lactoylglutathione lyase family enzyme
MQLQDVYPIVVTEHLVRCRDFYRQWFELQVLFEASWFVLLGTGESGRATVAFMHPSHPSAPPGPATFNGKGMCLEFQVDDAAGAYATFRDGGAPIERPLCDEPFGQRRFGFFDPAGVWLDVVEQIDPEPGWWDRYLQP